MTNKYVKTPYSYAPNAAQYQQQINQSQQPQQNQADVNDMLKIAMETQEGKTAYQEWLTQRDIALSRIAREVPEGAQAYINFENKIKEIYNKVLLDTVKNKSNTNETQELKSKNETLEKQMQAMQEQIDKLKESKNDKSSK